MTTSTSHLVDDGFEASLLELQPIHGLEKVRNTTLQEAIEFALEGDGVRHHGSQLLRDHKKECLAAVKQAKEFAEDLLRKDPSDPLSVEMIAAVNLYTQDSVFFKTLNASLRTPERAALKPFCAYLKLFLRALYRLPHVKQTLFRSVNVDLHGTYSGHFAAGRIFTTWDAMSCTTDLNVFSKPDFCDVKKSRTILSIDACQGYPIAKYSAYKV